jgi:RHS repeat-associated protein
LTARRGAGGSRAPEHDAENRLTRLSEAGSLIVQYGYAADGARLWKRKNEAELQVWIGTLSQEKGGKTLFHVFAGDERVCTFEPGSVLAGGGDSSKMGYYYHQDQLTCSSALSGSAGQQLGVNVWYPFGRTQTATPQAAFKVSTRFTGQVFDEESGLYYYGARYYDPELGRFIQPDTIIPDLSNPQSYNRYSYVLNNPLRYTDPTGHISQKELDDLTAAAGKLHGRDWLNYAEAANDLGIPGHEIMRGMSGEGAAVSATARVAAPAAEAYVTVVPDLGTAGLASAPIVVIRVGRTAEAHATEFAVRGAQRGVGRIETGTLGSQANIVADVPKVFDVVPYWRSAAGFEKHHGVLDAWARANVPGYASGRAPSILLTGEQHNATRAVFNAWRAEQGWARQAIDWKKVSPQQAQALSQRMFKAAGVPEKAANAFFREFHRYIYGAK